MNGDNDPLLRRELESVYDRLAERIEHVRELQGQQEQAWDRALVIRTTEIERRLELLNNEYARAAEERARVVSADTWSQFMLSFDEWRTGINDFRSNWQGRSAVYSAVVALVVSAGVALLVQLLS